MADYIIPDVSASFDALGPIASGQTGDWDMRELPIYDTVEEGFSDYPHESRGLSDYVGEAGMHPDHTPVDVFMSHEGTALTVGYRMLGYDD